MSAPTSRISAFRLPPSAFALLLALLLTTGPGWTWERGRVIFSIGSGLQGWCAKRVLTGWHTHLLWLDDPAACRQLRAGTPITILVDQVDGSVSTWRQ